MSTFLTYYEAGGKGKEVIWMDATTLVDPKFRNKVTEFPVEDGLTASDHIINENLRITVEGQVSNSQVFVLDGNIIDNQGANRVLVAYNAIKGLWLSKSPCTITTDLDEYKNCYIESFTAPRDVRGLEVLGLSINFVQLRTVNSQTAVEAQVVNQYIKDSVAAPKPVSKSPTEQVQAANRRNFLGQGGR